MFVTVIPMKHATQRNPLCGREFVAGWQLSRTNDYDKPTHSGCATP